MCDNHLDFLISLLKKTVSYLQCKLANVAFLFHIFATLINLMPKNNDNVNKLDINGYSFQDILNFAKQQYVCN